MCCSWQKVRWHSINENIYGVIGQEFLNGDLKGDLRDLKVPFIAVILNVVNNP